MLRISDRRVVGSCCLLFLAGCASLPDTRFLSQRYTAQAAHFESARGPLSARRAAAIVAELKRKSGDLDILDKQIAIEQEIAGNALITGNRVTLLQDGNATYTAMFAAIASARDHVNVESYIIDDDEIGRQFASLLLDCQSRGVQVNLIYDSVGSIGTPRAFFDRLSAAGVKVLEFNPVNPLLQRKLWSPNHRDHRKLLVIDGRTAFLGGINISSVNSSGSSVKHGDEADALSSGWRDTDIRVEGPVVGEYQKLFMQTWARQKGEALAGRDYFPLIAAQGSDLVRAVGSTPDDSYSQIYLMLIAAITNAEKLVYITNAYFVPDPQLINALLDAARRGVDVRLILPGHSDSNAAYYAGRSHFTELLGAGVKIYQRRGALLHVKTAVIDGVWSSLGSSNLDWRSALDNDEVNGVVVGREFAAQMLAAYATDIAASEAVELGAWKRRPFVLKLKEWAARVFGRAL